MKLHIFGYEDFKNAFNFFKHWTFPHFMEKWKILLNFFFNFLKISQSALIMSVFNWIKCKIRVHCLRKLSKKLLKLSGVLWNKLILRPPLKSLQQRINGRRLFLNLVVLILNTNGGWRWCMSDVWQPFSAPVIHCNDQHEFFGKTWR